MRSARKLTLKKESLTELATGDLSQVAGAAETVVWCTVSRVMECPTRNTPVCEVISKILITCLTEPCP